MRSGFKDRGRADGCRGHQIMVNHICDVWDEYPDMRFGQLIANVMDSKGGGMQLFHIEDLKLLELLEQGL